MKKFCLLALAVAISIQSMAQLNWSRVKIFGTENELRHLGELGLPMDHGEYKKDTYFITDLSDADLTILTDQGYSFEVLIADVKAYYVEQNEQAANEPTRTSCPTVGGPAYDPITPSNFQLGTMGGYYKYQEFLDELDSMRSKYPNLISIRTPIDTYTTVNGNPVYWVRVSDNPDTDEAEEEVLYSALHHAREPASLSQLIYFMWYMLENYGTDEEVTYLIDNTEMYFIPMLNPDGYRYNELTDPNGGGMHRKNRNLVSGGSGNAGVDLNRNYSYHWNETGTSGNPGNDTWAGVSAFSEVETNAMRWFVEQHDFKFAFNAHTHGNLLLYPIGWSDVEFAPHHDYFQQYTTHMVKHNGYFNQKSSGLYPAAGDSDDWMYIDDIGVNGKDTIFAMTPEVSSEGTANDFWPPSSSIEGICKANIHMNMTLAHMPHVFGVTTDLTSSKVSTTSGYFNYELERLGLMDGDLTVSMTAIAGIQSFGGPNTHTLNLMEIIEDSIQFTLNSGIQFGDNIIYVLETFNGSWTKKDTIYKTYGAGTALFTDNCTNLDNWTGNWSFTNEDYISPNNCITDSPFVNYQNNANKNCQLIQAFNLTNATYAYVNFWAKWEIEDNWDYVQFMASTDGGTSWTPLCGKYTNQGGSNQDQDEPLYDNFQAEWVLEEIDLSAYLGEPNVKFKFRLIADGGVTEDGFYFDDFSLFTDAADSVDDSGFEQLVANAIQLYPNPATNQLSVVIDHAAADQLMITNELGQVVLQLPVNANKMIINTTDLAEGIYFLNVRSTEGESATKRFVILR